MNNEVVGVASDTVSEATPAAKPKAIDFDQIDALRKHMLLTVGSMAELLGASRVSYYNWLKGGGVRGPRAKSIRKTVRLLVAAVTQHDWPNATVFVADQQSRLQMIKELIATIDNEPVTQ